MSGVTFNISSKDIIVTYTNSLLTVPILINGSGTDNIISFDSVETADLKPLADGNYASHVKAAVASGKITLCGTSPTLTQFLNVLSTQYTLGGGLVGSINIANPSNGSDYSINTIVITAAPPIPTFGTEIKDIEVSFKCQPIANITTLSAVIDSARAIASLI
jgi:hypothetical protein